MKKLYVLPLLSLTGIANASFPDVADNHPHLDAINYVQEKGIVEGNPDGNYGPDDQITRAAFTKIVVEANYSKEIIENCGEGNTDFGDVAEGVWFDKYVCVSVAKGLVGGYPDGTFKPANTINLAEASKIVAGTLGTNTNTEATPWYKPFLQELGSLNALPKELNTPADPLTRGQMAEMIYRVQNTDLKKDSHSYESISGMTNVVETKVMVLPEGSFDTWTVLIPFGEYTEQNAAGSVGARPYQESDTSIELIGAFETLPELEEGFFYEGWIVRHGDNLDVTSTGELFPHDGGFVNHFIGEDQDYSQHDTYVITLEPDDGNPAPDKHVIEGPFTNPLTKIVQNTEDDPSLGNGKIIVVEYTDFQCPFCLRLHNNTSDYIQELAVNDEITYTVKDFPLAFHQEALWAHIAANTVLDQKNSETYFLFMDKVFDEYPHWTSQGDQTAQEFLLELAEEVGVTEIDWDNAKIRNEITTDTQEGMDSGVTGTPTMFINGKKVSGAIDLETFKKLIEEAR